MASASQVLTSPAGPVTVPVAVSARPSGTKAARIAETGIARAAEAGAQAAGAEAEPGELEARSQAAGIGREAGGPPPSGSSMILGFGEPPFPKNATQAQLRRPITVPVRVRVLPSGEVEAVTVVAPSGYQALDAFAANFARRGIRYRPYPCAYSVTVQITFDPDDGGRVLVTRPDESERIQACDGGQG